MVAQPTMEVMTKAERAHMFGIECAEALVWRKWAVGGEYMKVLTVRNVTAYTQRVTYTLPANHCFGMEYPAPIKLAAGTSTTLQVNRLTAWGRTCGAVGARLWSAGEALVGGLTTHTLVSWHSLGCPWCLLRVKKDLGAPRGTGAERMDRVAHRHPGCVNCEAVGSDGRCVGLGR